MIKTHSHSNLAVLERLGDNAGDLEYDGNPIGGGSSGGSTISTPKVYYVESTGNDDTGAVGNPALPYATGTAAYNAGVTAAVPFVIRFGVGSFSISLGAANFSALCKQVIGCGAVGASSEGPTTLSVSGAGADGTNEIAAGDGPDISIHAALIELSVSSTGGTQSATGNEFEGLKAGDGGDIIVTGHGVTLTVASNGGNAGSNPEFENIEGGNGGNITLAGVTLVGAPSSAGGTGDFASGGTMGDINCDNCDLRTVGTVTANSLNLGRCAYITGLSFSADKGGNAAW